ncbi:MAG: hypothetical protein AAF670_14495 [Planctomycetota bacterium]
MKMNWIYRLADFVRFADAGLDSTRSRDRRPGNPPSRWIRWSSAVALSTAVTGGLAGSCGSSTLIAQDVATAGGTVTHDGQSYPIVTASTAGDWLQFPTMSDSASAANPLGISQVACQNGSCGHTSGVTSDGFTTGGCMECPKCIPYCYGIVEALYMRRENMDERSFSEQFQLDEPDFEFAPRITIGTVPDCVNGIETSFTGPFFWETEEASPFVTDAYVPRLVLSTANPFNSSVELFAFGLDTDPLAAPVATAADQQTQRYESEYWSLESSRTMIAWDVAKFLIGGRFINFNEEFDFASQNFEGDANDNRDGRGLIESDTQNRLVGLQVGLDVYNPTSRFCSTYFRGRAGAFVNLAESDFLLTTSTVTTVGGVAGAADNRTVLRRSNSENELAGLIEIGTGLRYQSGDILTLRAGTELWYLTGVATATDQIGSVLSPATGSGISVDDDVVFVGFTVGAEVKW